MDAQWLLDTFRTRSDVHAQVRVSQFSPEYTGLTLEHTQAHLDQVQAVGSYVLDEEDKARWIVLDIDNHSKTDEQSAKVAEITRSLLAALDALGIPFLTEISQSGWGVHLWVFCSEPVEGSLALDFGRAVLSYAHVSRSDVEVYPRQGSRFDSAKKMGSLIRLPGWLHSRFIDHNTREDIPGTPTVTYVSPDVLASIVLQVESSPSARDEASRDIPELVKTVIEGGSDPVLINRWMGNETAGADNTNSGIMFDLMVRLVRSLIPEADIVQAMVAWAHIRNYRITERQIRSQLPVVYDMAAGRERWDAEHGYGRTGNEEAITLDALLLMDEVKVPMVSTGLTDLDYELGGGIALGELVTILGLPSHGKSLVALQLAEAFSRVGPVLLLSYEMSRRQVRQRLLSKVAGDVVTTALAMKQNHPVYTLFEAGTWEQTDQLIRQYVQEKGVCSVILDYTLKIIPVSGEDPRSPQAIARTLHGMQTLGHQYGIIPVALGQFRPQVGTEKRLGDIYDAWGGSAFAFDSDVCLGVCLPHKYFPEDEPEDRIVVSNLKNKSRGVKNTHVNLRVDLETQALYDAHVTP